MFTGPKNVNSATTGIRPPRQVNLSAPTETQHMETQQTACSVFEYKL